MTRAPVRPPPHPVEWAFRRQTLASTQSFLRILNAAVQSYGPDLEGLVVYLAVTCASVERALRDAQLAAEPPPPGPMPQRHYRPISRRAIAASTGLPRETVRRKIAAYLARGDLVTDGVGVRIPQGLLENPRHFDFARQIVQEVLRAAEQIERIRAQAATAQPGA
jgi:hypothetical protein